MNYGKAEKLKMERLARRRVLYGHGKEVARINYGHGKEVARINYGHREEIAIRKKQLAIDNEYKNIVRKREKKDKMIKDGQ
jgi:hypothetical protein